MKAEGDKPMRVTAIAPPATRGGNLWSMILMEPTICLALLFLTGGSIAGHIETIAGIGVVLGAN
jgi:hypothetical protein